MAQWLAMMRGTLFATILLGFCLYWSVGTNVDNIPGWANINSEWQYRNVTLLSTAAATGSLLYIALDGSFAPLQFFLAMPIWQPFSSLSYTGYLLQIIIVNAVCTVSTRHTLEWDGDMWDYTANYLVVLLANLMAACLLSIAIERPVINMFTQTGFEYT
jgi:peptidoglycan/LPS O-acetylase OafA/YrhL